MNPATIVTSSNGYTKTRRPPSNVRHENKANKMTKVGTSGIYYSDDKVILGGAAIIYEGYYQSPERKVAVKRVLRDNVDTSKDELDIWLKATDNAVRKENVNIVQLFHWTEFTEGSCVNLYFAMEIATCNLDQALEKIRSNSEDDPDPDWRKKCVGYLKDAANGLSWLHSRRVIHRDIKPPNILIFCNLDTGQATAKLSDFGISKNLLGLTKSGMDTHGKGTENWMPPESIKAMAEGTKHFITKAVDICSLGMTAHYTMTQGEKHPFAEGPYGKMVSMNIVSPEVQPGKIENGEDSANHLFQWMMSYESKNRPNIHQVTSHPFFWTTRKQLKFILDVAKSLERNPNDDGSIQRVKDAMDTKYKTMHVNFNWRSALESPLDTSIFQRKSTKPGGKPTKDNYDGSCVSSLVKLIRDKDVHHTDLVDALISQSYFGRMSEDGEWIYCEEKYANYFCSKFSDLVTFLFVFLIKCEATDKLNSIKSVRWKYGLKTYDRQSIPDSGKNTNNKVYS